MGVSALVSGESAALRGDRAPTVSVVIPCLNEAETVAACVTLARETLASKGIDGEVIVVDNGSTDGSAELAREAGARVVHEPRRGYGSAYLAGFRVARGEYLVVADADLTYDFGEIPRFLEELDSGAELVMGNRMKNIHPGAMPWLHQYVGNPAMTAFLNVLFKTGVGDAWCGMRALRRDVLPRLDLRSTGMEFALEMVIRAAKEGLVVREVPIELHPRGGESKLARFRDGWRALRFMLVHSPTHLFVLPGMVAVLLGTIAVVTVLAQLTVFGREWHLHAMIGGCLLVMLGTQVIGLGLCARAYAVYFMGERDALIDRFRRTLRLEHGLLLGGGLFLAGLVLGVVVVGVWLERGLGSLSEERAGLLAATLTVVGAQVIFTSFLLSILGLRSSTADALRRG